MLSQLCKVDEHPRKNALKWCVKLKVFGVDYDKKVKTVNSD